VVVKVWYSKITACQGLQGERASKAKGITTAFSGPFSRGSNKFCITQTSFYKLFGGSEKASLPDLAVQSQLVKVRLVCNV
jgi:hypothetical protein